MSQRVRLCGLNGRPGSRLATLLGDGLEPIAPLRGASGCFERIVAGVVVAEAGAAGEGLPPGSAQGEALAVRLREQGDEIAWDEPVAVSGLGDLLERCRQRGRDSVAVLEADPALLPGLQIGAWFDAPWRTRALRRLAGRGGSRALAPLAFRSRRWLTAMADLAFWAGVRDSADAAQWQRLTRSSYVGLVYHRFAGEMKPGQERIDIAPRRFARQLRALRLAGFRPLGPDDLVAFHAATDLIEGRRVAITVDDGMRDCLAPLRRHADWLPLLFVPTRELGGSADWIGGEPVASWDEVEELSEAGVAIGSHARHHRRLTPLDTAAREEELSGSLADLREHLPSPSAAIAYPNGDHDAELCRQSAAAGYSLGFTTEKGRNGAGADPRCLKRVSVHGDDGALAILWKATTGEGLPSAWLRMRRLLRRQPGG